MRKYLNEEYLKNNPKFGQLTFISMGERNKSGSYSCKWRCDCGKEVSILRTNVVTGHTKSCGCSRYQSGKKHRGWTGHGNIPGSFWAMLKQNAKRRNIHVDITIADAWNLLERQSHKCALTNMDLKFDSRCDVYDGNASLDRIDSTKGYTTDNIQWVHKDVNYMKQEYSQPYFVSMCKKVSMVFDKI